MSGVKALALAGLLGLVNTVTAQPPAAPAKAPPASALPIGAVVGDSVGMVTIPIRATADTLVAGRGTICGKLTLGSAVAANKAVYLVEGGKVVAAATTDADGAFDLSAPRAGEFTFMAGPFDLNGVVRRMVRIDAAEGTTQAVVLQQKGAAPGALAPKAVNQESVLSPIGNKASGNQDVTFVNGQFVVNGQPVAAGNEYVILEAGSFRGIVTAVDDNGVRTTIPGANLYLIRRGQVVARTASGANGAFTFSGAAPGGYTVLATIGGYGVADVSLNGIPGIDQPGVAVAAAAAPVGPVAPVPAAVAPMAPVASPYFAGMTAGVPAAVSVRFPFQAIAVQRIALRDGAVAPAGVSGVDAEFRMEGADDVLVKVAFCMANAAVVPVLNLTPAPWEDLRVLIGTATFEAPPLGLAPTPMMDFGGGGFGGGGGGGGFGGAGALAGLAAAAAIAAGGGGGDGGGGGGFASPFRP